MESLLQGVDGFMYPNEVELQWSVLIVLYPYITGLVAGAFILAFTWREPPAWRTGLIGVALALVVAVTVTLLFERVFLVRLP